MVNAGQWPKSFHWGHGEALSGSVRVFPPALGLEKGGTASPVWDSGHCVRRQSRIRYLFQFATAFVHSSRQPDARRRGILKLLGFLTGRRLAIVAPLLFIITVGSPPLGSNDSG